MDTQAQEHRKEVPNAKSLKGREASLSKTTARFSSGIALDTLRKRNLMHVHRIRDVTAVQI
jgi:hypothetical protein